MFMLKLPNHDLNLNLGILLNARLKGNIHKWFLLAEDF